MENIMTIVRAVRAVVMRNIRTREGYFAARSLKPISTRYGFDRGKPVDRYYIEQFLDSNRESIRGKCLEVVDNTYTVTYGMNRVTQSEVLDIIPRTTTTIAGDLRDLSGVIGDNEFDCFILTQTLNVIDDYEAAIRESYRILKPGGTLLVTLPTMSPAWNLKINMWRFTVASAEHVFSKYFSRDHLSVTGLGNRLSAESFWVGLAVEDLTQEELEKSDAAFPLIIGIKATK